MDGHNIGSGMMSHGIRFQGDKNFKFDFFEPYADSGIFIVFIFITLK